MPSCRYRNPFTRLAARGTHQEEYMKQQQFGRLPIWCLGFGVLVMALASGCSAAGSAPSANSDASSAPASAAPLTITSTLEGHASLPHRIYWQATPSVPGADVSE